MSEKTKNEVIEESKRDFHELYSGSTYPNISVEKVEFFVRRALNSYERKNSIERGTEKWD